MEILKKYLKQETTWVGIATIVIGALNGVEDGATWTTIIVTALGGLLTLFNQKKNLIVGKGSGGAAALLPLLLPIGLLAASVVACGPVPYDACAPDELGAMRCSGASQQQCDGLNWYPVLECDQLTDADGNRVSMTCVEQEGGGVTCN